MTKYAIILHYSKKELPEVCKYFLSFIVLLLTGHTAVTGWAESSIQNQSCRTFHRSLKELSTVYREAQWLSLSKHFPNIPKFSVHMFLSPRIRRRLFFFVSMNPTGLHVVIQGSKTQHCVQTKTNCLSLLSDSQT